MGELINFDIEDYASMNPTQLEGYELSYELRVRGETTVQGRSEMQQRLRQFLAENPPDASVVPPQIEELPFERVWCRGVITELEKRLERLPLMEDLDRMKSRMIHMAARLARNAAVDSEGFQSQLERLQELRGIWITLRNGQSASVTSQPRSDATLDRTTSMSDDRTSELTPLHDLIRSLSDQVEQLQRQLNQREAASSLVQVRPQTLGNLDRLRGLPVAKWGIDKFDGNPDHLARFLAKVDHFASAEGATAEDLLRHRIHLFTGDALDWVLNVSVSSWTELKAGLNRFVHGASSDFERLMIIDKMRQGQENSSVFINRMVLQFRSLTKPPGESEQIDFILRGLRPNIGSILASNLTLIRVEDVVTAAMRVERVLKARRGVGYVAELGGETPSKGGEAEKVAVEVIPRRYDNHTDKQVKCYNCGIMGHLSDQCQGPMTCFGCGDINVRKRDCAYCQSKN